MSNKRHIKNEASQDSKPSHKNFRTTAFATIVNSPQAVASTTHKRGASLQQTAAPKFSTFDAHEKSSIKVKMESLHTAVKRQSPTIEKMNRTMMTDVRHDEGWAKPAPVAQRNSLMIKNQQTNHLPNLTKNEIPAAAVYSS